MIFFDTHFEQIITTIILIILIFFLRYTTVRMINRYASQIETLDHRKNLIIKYFNIVISFFFFITLFVIWGVQTKDLFIVVSSIATVIGVAFFAQWSILSNITSGIIILISFPFKIGDTIKIHDSDFPIEAEVEYIKTFYIILKTKEGEIITYPNNLLLQKGITIVKSLVKENDFTD